MAEGRCDIGAHRDRRVCPNINSMFADRVGFTCSLQALINGHDAPSSSPGFRLLKYPHNRAVS